MTLAKHSASTTTLDRFLTQPETKPASEYIDGMTYQKPVPRGRQFNYEMQRVLMKQRILRKGYDSQEIFSVCDL